MLLQDAFAENLGGYAWRAGKALIIELSLTSILYHLPVRTGLVSPNTLCVVRKGSEAGVFAWRHNEIRKFLISLQLAAGGCNKLRVVVIDSLWASKVATVLIAIVILIVLVKGRSPSAGRLLAPTEITFVKPFQVRPNTPFHVHLLTCVIVFSALRTLFSITVSLWIYNWCELYFFESQPWSLTVLVVLVHRRFTLFLFRTPIVRV